MNLFNVMDTCVLTARNVAMSKGILLSNTAEGIMSEITGEKNDEMGKLGQTITDTGNGFIYIAMTVVGIVGVLGLLITAAKLMLGGSQTKAEAKGSLLWILIAAIVGFGAIGIIGLMASMSGSFFG